MQGVYLLIVGALALTDALFGHAIQAWYRTMPPERARSIGALAILAIFGISNLLGAYYFSRKPDA